MLGFARDAGHEITANAADAEAIVVNTCAFIDRAKEESVDAILEMARLKRDGGCKNARRHRLPGRAVRRRAAREIPEIDVVLGTGDVPGITDALEGWPAAGTSPLRLFKTGRGPPVAGRRGRWVDHTDDDGTRRTSTTPRRRACSRRRSTTPT